MGTQRSAALGPASRPVSIPDDLTSSSQSTLKGIVVLPNHIRWTPPILEYDLSRVVDRVRVYELVMCEGNEDDVRRFINVDDLVQLWDRIYLPEYVRRPWATWLKSHGYQVQEC